VNRPAKYVAILPLLAISYIASACGGGGTITANPAPGPAAGPYSASSLNGTYAFTLSGTDSGGFFVRVGSFAANGNGTVTGGVQDLNSGRVPGSTTLTVSSGSYSLQSNGKGTLTLVDSSETVQLSIVMTSATAGLITETDGNATASGNFTLQDTTTFATFPTTISGPYVFDISGLDPNGSNESFVGQFVGNAGGGISTGVVDINDNFSASGQLPITTASFTRDATNASTFGRGTAVFTINGSTLNFAFYTVGAGRLRLMRTDFPAAGLGDAVAQTGTIPTTASGLSGNFAFIVAGSSLSGSEVRGGRFTLNGGAVTNIQLDDDDSSASGSGNSNHTAIPKGTISAATYTVDSSGEGGGTITFTDSSNGTFSFIFYLISPTQAVIQDVSVGQGTVPIITADGSMQMQTGSTLTTATEAGNWGFNWSGLSINGTTGILAEEDFVGQYTQTSSGSISGGVDFTELSARSVVIGAAFSGSLALIGDGTGRNTYTITLATSPSSTLNFAAYLVDPNTTFVVGVDTHRTIVGSILRNY
jgi:hypothetical protein